MLEDLTEPVISTERMSKISSVEELSVELAIRGVSDGMTPLGAMRFLTEWILSTWRLEFRDEDASSSGRGVALRFLMDGFSEENCRKFFLDKGFYSDLIMNVRAECIRQVSKRHHLGEITDISPISALSALSFSTVIYKSDFLVEVTKKIICLDDMFISELKSSDGKNVACIVSDLFGFTAAATLLSKVRVVGWGGVCDDFIPSGSPFNTLFSLYRKCGCEVYHGLFSDGALSE